jgi:hypothetical protein
MRNEWTIKQERLILLLLFSLSIFINLNNTIQQQQQQQLKIKIESFYKKKLLYIKLFFLSFVSIIITSYKKILRKLF